MHGVAADAVEAAALALNAGVDIDMASGVYLEGLPEALARGLVTIEQIDAAVRRVLHAEGAARIVRCAVRAGRHAADGSAAKRASRFGPRGGSKINRAPEERKRLLPLQGDAGRLAIVGPLADNRAEMLGCWRAAGKGEEAVSFLDGLRQVLPGWRIGHEAGAGIQASLDLISDADAVLLCVGESSGMTGEANSRARPTLPEDQR